MVFPALKSRYGYICAASALALILNPKVQAIEVDTELVVLVDTAADSSDFDLIIESVARSFEQQSFIDSVAAGANGSIAASLILFNVSNNESVSVSIPWMELSSAADLQNFANTVRGVQRLNVGNVSYANAIAEGAAEIASSVFEGTTSQLTVIDDGSGFFEAQPAATRAARDVALASSVDVINAIVFDVAFQVNTVENYYNDNVVGGLNGSVVAIDSPQGGPKPLEDLDAIEDAISFQITDSTVTNVSAVPEPSSSLLLIASSLGLLARRKR